MISEDCDLDSFISAVKDLTYHEVLTSTLKEGYGTDDLIVHKKKEGAPAEEIERISEYNRALRSFIFLLQTGQRPDLATAEEKEGYNKFRHIAKGLVDRGELLPAILDYFDE
ncbi:MAG TPA: hypothetical protein P5049_04585 [Methanothrix sp.]|nr:hypothetical protein [Methanothrix sp.]